MSAQVSTRASQIARWLIVWFIAFDVAFLWQKAGGAYESEFGAHPDEAAHYVTGLFVRDAITTIPKCLSERSLQPLAPFKSKDSADGFYAHYPKVALGVWPPSFYVLQSAWTLPFGVSRTSVLVLMAVLATANAALIFRVIRSEFGDWPAAAGALLWLSFPLVRESYSMVMAEMLCTLCMVGATVAWGRFLDERKTSAAAWFGVLAAVAILTKGTGVALALMCVLSILLTRRWSILAHRGTWVGGLLVLLIAGPWTWLFRKEGTRVGGWADNSGGLSWDFTQKALGYYGEILAFSLGIAVASFAVVGGVLRGFRTSPKQGKWASLVALILGVFAFQCLIPVGHEARHLISTTPAIILLAIAGARALPELHGLRVEGPEQRRRQHLWVALVALLGVAAISWPIYQHRGVPKKGCTGFLPIAEEILGNSKPGTRILVSSDASGEGMLISELAMRDQRPNLFIDRASTVLVDAKSKKWDGRNLRSRFADDESLMNYLAGANLDYIVLDDAVPENKRTDYHDQLRRVIQENIGKFWQVMDSPVARDDELYLPPIKLFRVVKDR